MLLEREKSGVGSKRMIRASAFLEAAGRAEVMAAVEKTKTVRRALERLAGQFRDMALIEAVDRAEKDDSG